MTIEELHQQIIAFRDARDWKQFHNPKDLALSLVLESTEVLEHFQWKNGDELTKYTEKHKTDIGEELADVFWYLILLSDGMNVDLAKAVQSKLAKNVERYSIAKARGNHKKYTELTDQ